MPSQPDTIAAAATARGESGIAIIRISGPDSVALTKKILRFGASGFPPPREMRLAALLDAEGVPVDQVLAVHFAAPKSYTGEDVVEIHTHGGTLVTGLCLEMLLRGGARMAEPGEFTRRAFLNGRMDLSQSESVLGIIQSRSSEALRAAARTLSGELSRFAREIHDELLRLQGDLEIGLDFPEGEPPQVDAETLVRALEKLKKKLQDLERRCSVGALLREGVRVVLSGRPNVGKSSLLNALVKQPRAIVTPLPGTTRDVIEESIVCRGIPVRLIDTAGLRDPVDEIEASGIERTHAALRQADICLWVLDASRPLDNEDVDYLRGLDSEHSLVALNKSDLLNIFLTKEKIEKIINAANPASKTGPLKVLSLSAMTGEGLEDLREAIASMCLRENSPDAGLNVTARQLEDIRACSRAVDGAQDAAAQETGQDVTAGLLGEARYSLERLLGLSHDDILLDSIFSRFCVGK